MATTKLMTAAELYELPNTERFELIRGELVEMAPTGFDHSDIAAELISRVRMFAREHGLGRVTGEGAGYRLEADPDVVLAPDVAFVRADRLPPREDRRGYLPLAPDLVVEVISPSDRAGQVLAKVNLYLTAGVPLLWLVDPEQQTVAAFTPDRPARVYSAPDTLTGADVLPGFELPIRELFS